MNTAKDLAKLTGLQARHIWHDVRRRGIEPRPVDGILVLTDEQTRKYLQLREEKHYTVKPKPRKPAQKRKPKPRKETAVTAQAVTLTSAKGQEYLYIPAPWEVPQAWEWRA